MIIFVFWQPGTQSVIQSGCIPFNDAVELGKEEAAAEASSSVVAHASASASATPTSTSRML